MDILNACVRFPHFHVRHVMGSRYMFVRWFGVDVIVELGFGLII